MADLYMPINQKQSKLLTVPMWLIVKKGEERRFSATTPLAAEWRASVLARGYQIFRVDVFMPEDWGDEKLEVNYATSEEVTNDHAVLKVDPGT